MRYRIHHRTEYQFSRAVFLEPHILRLVPACDATQALREFSIHLDPEPACLSHQQDQENNTVCLAWFNDTTDHLTIATESVVETRRENPFDYIPEEGRCGLPVDYTGHSGSAPARYLIRDQGSEPNVDEFARTIASTVSGRLIPFLSALNDCLYRKIRCVIRDEGDPFPPAHTLHLEEAACRDIAVLFVDACRSQGVAARFVSGFQEGDPVQDGRYLHAWAEVLVPGGGWRGYDPTYGLAVSDRHIPIAAAATPAGAAPVSGTFRGTHATTTLSTHLEIERLNLLPA